LKKEQLIAEEHPRELRVVEDAISGIPASVEGGAHWLARKLVLARGYYAPDHFEYMDVVEIPEVEVAWAVIGESLLQRELQYMFGMGGHPGGSWADILRAHDFPGGTRLYTWETDIADVGQQCALLFATAEQANAGVDERVVETALSIRPPLGLELARYVLSGTLDEMRTVLPRERLWPLLVDVLDDADGGLEWFDENLEEVANEAPEDLRPWTPEWKTWLVETYVTPSLERDPDWLEKLWGRTQ